MRIAISGLSISFLKLAKVSAYFFPSLVFIRIKLGVILSKTASRIEQRNEKNIDHKVIIKKVKIINHFYKKIFNKKNFKNSINISKNSMHLPSSTILSRKEIKYISKKVKIFFTKRH